LTNHLNFTNLKAKRLTYLLVVSLFLQSCNSDEETPKEPNKPWVQNEISPGNFTVNTGDVILRPGSGSGYYSNGTFYTNNTVLRQELPSSPFEYYTIRAYIPVNDTYGARISKFGASLYYYNQNKERIPGDFDQSRFIQFYNSGGVEYSVFEIVVRDINLLADRENIEKVIFVFEATHYNLSTEEIENVELVNLEVFLDTESSGGSTSNGSVMFWVNQDYGCGTIDVTIPNFGTKTITSFFGSNPGCGIDGSANFSNMPLGTYNYSASGGSCSWSNSFSINSDCATIQLTL